MECPEGLVKVIKRDLQEKLDVPLIAWEIMMVHPLSFGVYGEWASETDHGDPAAMSHSEPMSSMGQYGILQNKTI